ncbi:MAG TPA: UDP-glucose/GDP-mannose dehydrogenase family protein [Bacilli bacterium]|nr:UDP-glucose/GDP-mannose dehydrogenase family protein [Bacilli bacterium]HOC80277.1 UDP-glucose/GDP-mannose dehydrogenase family protein [Bacilli bacterium]
MNITVIGQGYVGLVNSVILASFFHNVIGLDSDKNKVATLKQGIATIKEPNLQSLMSDAKDRLRFTTNGKDAIRPNKIIYIAVDTPEGKDGKPDMTNFNACLDDIAKNAIQDTYVVIRSTVPVGTNARVKKYLEENSEHKFEVISNPEFLSQGSAIDDMLNPSRVVIGVASKAGEDFMLQMYANYQKRKIPILITTPESAELIKYASNNFLAMKISYINEIARLCEMVDADIEEVAIGIGLDPRIGRNYLKAGIGYGGSCFPKDTKALSWFANDREVPLELVKATIKVNNEQPSLLMHKINSHFRSLSNLTIAVLGVAFKAGTEDIRNSPATAVVKYLLEKNAYVKVYDALAIENFQKEMQRHSRIEYSTSILDTLKEADAVVILTDAKELKELDKSCFIDNMKKPIIFDGRNLYRPANMVGTTYYSIGRKTVK